MGIVMNIVCKIDGDRVSVNSDRMSVNSDGMSWNSSREGARMVR